MPKLICSDVREGLASLPPQSVHCVVTSPPYFQARAYKGVEPTKWWNGDECCLGNEKDVSSYIAHLVEVFYHLVRVLHPTATVFLNLGDKFTNKRLEGVPWRTAIALQDDRWFLANDIPWVKRNAFPSSVDTRVTHAHEHFFLLAKSPKYYYDVWAYRVPLDGTTRPKEIYTGEGKKDYESSNAPNPSDSKRSILKSLRKNGNTRQLRTSDFWIQSVRDLLGDTEGPLVDPSTGEIVALRVNTKPSKEDHFATYSPSLIAPLISVGSSPQVCMECGAPYRRVVEMVTETNKWGDGEAQKQRNKDTQRPGSGGCILPPGSCGDPAVRRTVGWEATCECEGNFLATRSVVLDPFCGTGTTGVVAEALGRDFIGIDSSPDFIAMAEKRLGTT
jgi:DNA modification methylase